MASDDAPIVTEHRGGVAWIRLNRPERRNAVDDAARAQLAAAFDACSEDPGTRVVVLTGTGSAFCAGVDLQAGSARTQRGKLDLGEPLAAPLERCPVPVIAAVNGPAVGGGFELAMAADVRIAAESAFFALTELRLGSLPGSGGTQRLFEHLPASVAWQLLLTGDRLAASDAAAHGLVSEVHADEQLEERVTALATRVAEAAPLSLRAAKLAVGAARRGDAAGHTLERVLWRLLADTDDRAEGRLAFREKRPPAFRGT